MVSAFDSNKQPFFSVIMNCHNSALFLREAIDSVFAQDLDDWEFIFYDNASTDDSAIISQSYGRRVKYFHNPNKIPLGAARNRAIEQACGTYLAFLDCDDLWYHSKLRLQKKALEEGAPEKSLGICYTDGFRIDVEGKDLALCSREKLLRNGNVYCYMIEDDFIPMSSCVVDREIFIDVGGFNESYGYAEDWDLWLKISRSYNLALVDLPLVKVRMHSGNLSRNMLEHGLEMLKVIENIKPINTGEKKARTRTYRVIQIRLKISRLMVAIREKHKICSTFMRLILHVLWHPVTSAFLFKKYFNKDMLGILKKRINGQ